MADSVESQHAPMSEKPQVHGSPGCPLTTPATSVTWTTSKPAHREQDVEPAPDLATPQPDACDSIAEESPSNAKFGSFQRGLRRRVVHLTPSWFASVMGTGIASILLHNFPYPAQWLRDISVIIFVLNVVLASTLLLMSVARYMIWPKIFMLMLRHPVQSLFLGTFSMGWATIINMIVFVCVPRWGAHFATLAHVLYWIDVVVATLTCIGVPFIMFTRHEHAIAGLSAVWLLPIVTCVVLAATGGIVATVLDPYHARIVVITSYVLWGMGVPLSIIVMSPYFLRLAVHKVPPPESIVSVFLPVGPCGQGAFGILQLAIVVRKLAVENGTPLVYGSAAAGGVFDANDARVIADAIYGMSVLGALVLWGLGLFWLVIAVWTVLDMYRKGGFPFNMGWWGFTFPIGVFTTATNTLGAELDSMPFKVIGAALSVSVVLLWFVVAIGTAYRAVTGTIFVAPCLGPFGGEPPQSKTHQPTAV